MSELSAGKYNYKLRNVDDALDVIAGGQPGCIFTLDDVSGDFFNLKNEIAGDVFQKFTNYNFKAAFIIPDNHNFGERITELIRDHARHNCVRFFSNVNEADRWINDN